MADFPYNVTHCEHTNQRGSVGLLLDERCSQHNGSFTVFGLDLPSSAEIQLLAQNNVMFLNSTSANQQAFLIDSPFLYISSSDVHEHPNSILQREVFFLASMCYPTLFTVSKPLLRVVASPCMKAFRVRSQ